MARLQDDLQTLADLGMTGPDKTVTADAFFYDLILRVDDSSFLVHKVDKTESFIHASSQCVNPLMAFDSGFLDGTERLLSGTY